MWLCKCPSLMTHRKRRWWRWLNLAKLACFSCAMKSSLCFTFLLMRTGSSYGFWNMPEKRGHRPPHLFHAITSVLSVGLPFTWLPRMNLTETTSKTSKRLSMGSSSSTFQWPLNSRGQLAARPIYWSYAWAQACDFWFSKDQLCKG